METHERAREYDEVLVDLGSPINQDIHINRQYIYAMSKTKVGVTLISMTITRNGIILYYKAVIYITKIVTYNTAVMYITKALTYISKAITYITRLLYTLQR